MRLVSPLLALVLSVASLPAFAAADPYEIDKSHTRILFYVNHLGFSETIGDFTTYDGSFTFDEKKPQDSAVNITLKPASIRTASSELDKHLQNEQFFNTAKFPDITFVSKTVKITGKNTGDITGDLTLLGVTKPVTLKVTFNKADYHPYSKMYVAGFSGSATIKRSQFGMTNLIPAVSDEVRLEVQMEGVNTSRKKAEAIKRQ
jgi:polyisoprenoid-binding protein YceI